jgi:hypothetical protein
LFSPDFLLTQATHRELLCITLCDAENNIGFVLQLESILAFSAYDPLVDFARLFLPCLTEEGHKEKSMKEQLRALTYECCVQDKPMVLSVVMAFMQVN